MRHILLMFGVAAVGVMGPLEASAKKVKEAPDPSSPEFPAYVMTRVDDMYRGASSRGIMEMQIKTKHWARNMAMESWAMGKDHTLVRILRPRKERGTATLKAGKNLFIYLNKTGRTVKITSGMMGSSWMGSHFTNDDLVSQSRLSRDYTIKLTTKGTEKSVEKGAEKGAEKKTQQVYRFTLTAKHDAPVVWGKQVVTVRQSDLQPLSQVYYDEEGKKVRTMTFSEHQKVGDRMLPRKMVMKPLDGSGEYTRISWKKITFDVKLDQGFFSLQTLRSL